MSVICPDCREIATLSECQRCRGNICNKCNIKHVCPAERIQSALDRIGNYIGRNGWLVDFDTFNKFKWKRPIDAVASHELKVTWRYEHSGTKRSCTLAIRSIAIQESNRFSLIVNGEFVNAEPDGVEFHVYSLPFEPFVYDKVMFVSPSFNGRIFELQ